MNRRILWRVAASCAVALAAPVFGQAISSGTYVLDGGSYSIEVKQQGDTLQVDEPTGKHSEYQKQPDGSFHVYNPNTDTVYGIRYIDPQTIAAFKPLQDGNVPTLLRRVGGAPAVVEAELPPSTPAAAAEPGLATGTATVAQLAEGNDAAALAQTYLERARSDPANVQSWTACAAAALKRGTGTGAEADAYAAETVKMLKTILIDPARSPCEDVLPSALFAERPGLSAEEEAKLKELNARADARAEAGKVEAARQEAERAAYEAKVAEVKAAEQQYGRDRAAYEAEVARANAAKDAYERQMDDYRRRTGGASPQ